MLAEEFHILELISNHFPTISNKSTNSNQQILSFPTIFKSG